MTLCVAQEYYVNRIKIETYHNNKGNDKTFTYYVADSFDQVQLDNFKTDAGSIGSLYEDDYVSSDTCSTIQCANLRRIYEHTTTDGG